MPRPSPRATRSTAARPAATRSLSALAALTGRRVVPLDRAHGEHAPLAVARIDEAWCIGCTLCIDACPVDAIVGAAKRMHTVLPALCTGCELCLPPCPVDCIDMVPAGRAWSPADARAAGERFSDSRRARSEFDTRMTRSTTTARRPRPTRLRDRRKPRPSPPRLPGHALAARAAGPRPRMNPQKRRTIFERLRAANPHPASELDHRTPFELLVAVVLSAQATDKGVNKATEKLFPVANTPARDRRSSASTG